MPRTEPPPPDATFGDYGSFHYESDLMQVSVSLADWTFSGKGSVTGWDSPAWYWSGTEWTDTTSPDGWFFTTIGGLSGATTVNGRTPSQLRLGYQPWPAVDFIGYAPMLPNEAFAGGVSGQVWWSVTFEEKDLSGNPMWTSGTLSYVQEIQSIPEPTTFTLLGLGALKLLMRRRRKS